MAIALSAMAGVSLSGCKTVSKADMTPATLTKADRASMTAIKTAAAEVLGETSVALGASDLLNSSAVSVLPKRLAPVPGAPFSQQDFAIPTMLTLMTDGTNCYLVKDDTGEVVQVNDLSCRSVS